MDIGIFRDIAGLTAGALILVSGCIYVASILRGETKPDRATWWILFLGSGIIVASYSASGASDTLWLAIAYCMAYFVAAVLSIWYGEGSVHLTLFQKVCIAGALVSAALWWFTDNPEVALYFQMIMEMFALLPTIEKTFRDPRTESKAAWILATGAGFINLFAIGTWSLVIISYPVFVFITNGIVAALSLRVSRTL